MGDDSNKQLTAEQVRINISISEYHSEVDAFCASVARAPEHGLARDPQGNCPWVVKLSNLFDRHGAKLSPQHIIPYAALAGDRLVEVQEYDMARRCCYRMGMPGVGADDDPGTRLRCRVGSAYCLARIAQRKDPAGRNRETVDTMLQHALDIVRKCTKASPSLAWVVKNGTVLVYQIAMDLLTWGFANEASTVLTQVLDQLIAPSSTLSAPAHLAWRLQLCTALAFCHEERRDSEAFGALVDSALALWAEHDPALKPTPSQQRSQAKRLGEQLPLLVDRAKGLRMLRFKRDMFPIEPAEEPAEEESEVEELTEEQLQEEVQLVFAGLRENFSSWADQMLALNETLVRPWRRTVLSGAPPGSKLLRVRALLKSASAIGEAHIAENGVLPAAHRLTRDAFQYQCWEEYEALAALVIAHCGSQHEGVRTEVVLMNEVRKMSLQDDTSGVEDALAGRLAWLSSSTHDNADVAIVSDTARMIWEKVDKWGVISTPLQGRAFLEKQKLAEEQQPKTHSGKTKSILDMDTWKKRPEPPPPPSYNLAEAALNAMLAVRCPDTNFVLACAIRLALAMELATEFRRAIQTMRSALALTSRHRHMMLTQVKMEDVDNILSISTDLCSIRDRDGLQYTWSAELNDQSLLQMQVDAYSLLFHLELEGALHQAQLDPVIDHAPGQHKIAGAANVSGQLGLKKGREPKKMVVKGPSGEEVDLDEHKYSHKETALLAECRSSPYHKALLYIQIALFRKRRSEQLPEFRDKLFYKQLLEGAAKLLETARTDEIELLQWTRVKPKLVRAPRPPPARFVHRTPSSFTVEPVPFESSDGRAVHAYALFGKKYGTGVDVSLNNHEYPGLGVKVLASSEPVRLVVTGLSPNESFSFAVAAYDHQGIEIGGIGETCRAVTMLSPLPLTGCLATLSVAAFTTGCSTVMRSAAEVIHNRFVQAAPVGQLALQKALAAKDSSISTKIWLQDVAEVPSEAHLLDELDAAGFKRKENWQLAGAAVEGSIVFDRMLLFVRQKKVLLSFCSLQHAALAKEWFEAHPGQIFGAVFSKYEGGAPLLIRSPMEMEELDRDMVRTSPTALVRSFIMTEYMLVEATLQRILKKKPARDDDQKDSFHMPPLSKQITRLEACKRLTIALEASLAIDDDKLVVETISRIFRLLEPLLSMPQPTSYVLSVLVACDVAIKTMPAKRLAAIPKGRALSCSVMYLLQQLCNRLKEPQAALLFAGVKSSDEESQEPPATEESQQETQGEVEAEVLAFKEFMLVTYGKMPNLGPADAGALDQLKLEVLNTLSNDTAEAAYKLLMAEENHAHPMFAELAAKVLETAVNRDSVAMDTLREWHSAALEAVNQQQKLPALDLSVREPEEDAEEPAAAPVLDLPEDPTAYRIPATLMEQANTISRIISRLYQHNKTVRTKREIRDRDMRWKALSFLTLGMVGYEAEMKTALVLQSSAPEAGLDKNFLMIDDAKFLKKERDDRRRQEKIDALDNFERERLTNPDGTKRERPPTPILESVEAYEETQVDQTFQNLARAAVLASRAKVWVVMLNSCRIMFNLALKLYHTPADPVASWKRRTAQAQREVDIREQQLKKIRDPEKRAELQAEIDEHALVVSKGWRLSPAGCLQTAAECMMEYLDRCSHGTPAQEADDEEEPESDSSAEGKDAWFDSRPDVDIKACSKAFAFVVEMCYSAGRDRTTLDLGKYANSLTANKFAEPLMGFMMRAALRRTLEEELAELALQFKNIKRDKPLATDMLDAARRSLNEYLKRNALFKKPQNALVQNGSSALAGLLSKDNPAMLAIPAELSEQDKEAQAEREDVLSSYSKAITVLRQKKATFMVAQACNEAGNFSYAINQVSRAGEFWKDGLDAALLTLDSLKNWRSLFDRTSNLLEAFGFWEVLTGSVLLHHSAYFILGNDLHMRTEAVSMAARMLSAVYSSSFPHPQRACDFRSYKPQETWPNQFPLDLFADPYVLYPVTLVDALEYFSLELLRGHQCLEALPVLSLYNYVSEKLTNDYFGCLNARIKKVQALTQCGFVAEAVQELLDLLNGKHLPTAGFAARVSAAGASPEGWDELSFLNGVCPEDPRNLKAISAIVRSGVPKCIVDEQVSTPLDPHSERPYLQYQYALAVAQLLLFIGKGKNLLYPELDQPAQPTAEESAKCFFDAALAKPTIPATPEEMIPVTDYVNEAEGVLRELELVVVGEDQEGNPRNPKEVEGFLGESPEKDESFCLLSRELCELQIIRGNYEVAVKLLERILSSIEAQPTINTPPVDFYCSVPAPDWTARIRHPRSQLNTQLWLQTRTRLIEVFLMQGEYDACEQQCDITAKEAASCNEHQLARRVGVAHATVAMLRGRPQDALVEFEQIIASARTARAQGDVFVRALSNCGDIRRSMGQLDAAHALFHEAYNVMSDRLEALGLDTSALCAADPLSDFTVVRVLTRKEPSPEDAPTEEEDTTPKPEDPCQTSQWEVLCNLYHEPCQLFLDVALRKAQLKAEQHQFEDCLRLLSIARGVLLRTTHPLPRTVAEINLLFGRVHAQLIWQQFGASVSRWGMNTASTPEPDEQAFEFADSCLRESFRIMSEQSNHDHVMLRVTLFEMVRLHGLKASGAHVPLLLERCVQVGGMQHKLYHDTLSLFDAAEISGEHVNPGLAAGVIDSLRFFNQSRAVPQKTEDESGDSTLQVGAPALLMYHLTLVRERAMAGVHLGKLMQFNSTLLHRALKEMFPRYSEQCCGNASLLPAQEPQPSQVGVVSVVWAEFPLDSSGKLQNSGGSGSSRPSSAASLAVQRSRESETEVSGKQTPSIMIYSLAALEPEGKSGPIGMVQLEVAAVQRLHRDLCSVRYDLERHKQTQGDAAIPEELTGAVQECLASGRQLLQRQEREEADTALPEDLSGWISTLEGIFNRQVGFSATVDQELYRWLAESLRRE